jgi:sec-independent protein translocase protein TatA
MFGLGFSEILIILVLVLILFGAGKLPEVMGEMGRGLKAFKDEMEGTGSKPKPAAKAAAPKASAKPKAKKKPVQKKRK